MLKISAKTQYGLRALLYLARERERDRCTLHDIAKATSLSQTVEILLKDDYPLILVYRVGDMGKLQYCLAPAADGAS